MINKDVMFLRNRLKKLIEICICAAMMSVFFGCTSFINEPTTEQLEVVTVEQTAEGDESENAPETATSEADGVVPIDDESSGAKSREEGDEPFEKTSTSSGEYPAYSGEAFVELNENVPLFTDEEKKSTDAFEYYDSLDELGRCGVAYANICPELMPTEERGSIGDIRPSGWHTVKYPDLIEDNYLYNRSHLIAYSLAGENANPLNLITGTRFLNQETMQIFELKVLDYVRDTRNHVLYRVTPVFEGDNLLASGVQMEAWSVEDEGKGICFNVYCYNVQPGIKIDYATGDSEVALGQDAEMLKPEDTVTADTNKPSENAVVGENDAADSVNETSNQENGNQGGSDFESEERTYVLNTSSKKVHLPECNSVNDMADHNKEEYVGTLTELKGRGYSPCGRCLAEFRD